MWAPVGASMARHCVALPTYFQRYTLVLGMNGGSVVGSL